MKLLNTTALLAALMMLLLSSCGKDDDKTLHNNSHFSASFKTQETSRDFSHYIRVELGWINGSNDWNIESVAVETFEIKFESQSFVENDEIIDFTLTAAYPGVESYYYQGARDGLLKVKKNGETIDRNLYVTNNAGVIKFFNQLYNYSIKNKTDVNFTISGSSNISPSTQISVNFKSTQKYTIK